MGISKRSVFSIIKSNLKLNKYYNNMAINTKVSSLLSRHQPVQRTPDWYTARNTKITASEAASCLPFTEMLCKDYLSAFNQTFKNYNENKTLNSYKKKSEYIMDKCMSFHGKNTYKDSVYTLHGKKFEEIAVRFYKKLYNTDVLEFGLLTHQNYPWLAASPDGITPNGIMLEIKCPYSREIKDCPPIYYWVQMQIQLEVADLDQCHYLECEIKEITKEEFLIDNDTSTFIEKGIVLQKGNEHVYIYPPNNLNKIDEYLEWSDKWKNLDNSFNPTFYKIYNYSLLTITRNKEWFELVKDYLKETIDFIRNLQEKEELFQQFRMDTNKKYLEKYNKTECLID